MVASAKGPDPRRKPDRMLEQHRGKELHPNDTAEPQDATILQPYLVDLHGLSKSAASIVLHQVFRLSSL